MSDNTIFAIHDHKQRWSVLKWFYDTSIGTATRAAHCGS
jgi:hypothetical protein